MATTIDDNAADEKSDKSIWRLLNIRCTRACLKKAFRELRVSVCGSFYPNEGKIYRKVGLADCGNDFSDTL